MRAPLSILLLAATSMAALPVAAQRAPDSPPTVEPRPIPQGQPPNATIMAEPVALFIGACDNDGDAVVTRAEMTACVARSFATIDRDGKGSLGYIQFADWAERWLGDRNALPSPFETDSDGDNRITLAELQAQFETTFARLDRDKNAGLARSELLTIDGTRGLGGPGERGSRGRRPRQ